MKQTNFTRRQFLFAASTLALASVAPQKAFAPEASVKIKLGTLVPRGSSYHKHLLGMGEKWRQATDGGVTLMIYPDGTLGGEADMVRRMRLGQLQSGMLTAVGLAEIEPAVTGLQYMPMAFRSLEELDYVSEKLQPRLEKRIEEKGFVVLFWGDTGWVRYFSKRPVIHPDDLRKTKLFVWAGSPEQIDIYRRVGCNPVPLETTDILPNLQTGLIDAVPLPPYIALASQVDGVAPNMLDLNWAPLVGATVVTKKIWESIPTEKRAAMKEAALETGRLIKADSRREADEAIEAMRKRGLKVHALTPEIEAEWRREAEAIYPKIRGSIVPAEMFDEVMSLLKEYRAAKGGK